jgi:septum site-determining protein MinC
MTLPAEQRPPTGGALVLHALDGVLVLELDPSASFEALRQAVRDTFSATPDRFRGMDARLDLKARTIELFDLRRLIHVLKDEFGVTATGLYCTPENLQRYAERELKLRVWPRRAQDLDEPPTEDEPAQPTKPAAKAEASPAAKAESAPAPAAEDEVLVCEGDAEELAPVEPLGRRTLCIDRGLRSGQVVRYSGDVVVYGDVNPGAEIIAVGNVHVFGALKGTVHAGARGDESAIILSFDLRAPQLRIGRKIAFPAARPATNVRYGHAPEIAWVNGAEITIEPYAGRLPRNPGQS